jgi:rhamnulokinase
LLCQITADACHRQVVAGPVEATALGNMLIQAIAIGLLPDIATGRAAVAASFEQVTYQPHVSTDWDAAIIGFDALVGATVA